MNPREIPSDRNTGPNRRPPAASDTGAPHCLRIRSHGQRAAHPASASLRLAARKAPAPDRSLLRDYGQRGLTLFELALVLVLVGMLGAVAISRPSATNTDAFADGENLKGALRNARTRAMADIVSWSFTVTGQTGTLARNGVTKSTIAFETAGVAAGTTTFDYRGQPTGTLSYAVVGYSGSPVTVTTGTGFVP